MSEPAEHYLARSTDPHDPVEMRLPFTAPPLRFVDRDEEHHLAMQRLAQRERDWAEYMESMSTPGEA